MRFPLFRVLPFAFVWLTIAPLAAQTATPSSVTFCYTQGSPQPGPQTVTVKDSTGTLVTVNSVSLALGASSPFDAAITGTGSVNVGFKLSTITQTTYTDTLTINTATNSIQVPLTFSTLAGCVPTGGGGGGTGAITASSNPVALSVAVGSVIQTAINLTSNSNVNITVSSQGTSGAVTWLSAQGPASLTANSPAPLTINASAISLQAGSYTGQVLIQVGGATALTVQVNLTVTSGQAGPAVFLSPSSFTFTPGGAVPVPPNLVIATNANTAYTITSNQSWLSVSPCSSSGTNCQTPSQSAGGQTDSVGAGLVALTINPAGLAANTYTATLTVSAAGGSTIQTVMLTVGSGGGGGVTVSSTSLAFSGASTLTAPLSQTLTVTSSQAFTVFATSDHSWLSVSPPNGPAGSTLLTVFAQTTGLAPGSYSGSLSLNSTSGSANVPVTLTVTGSGSTGGLTVSPAALQFSSTSNLPQTVALGGLTGQQFSVATTANQSWLVVSPSSGIVGTNNLTVTTVPGNLAAGAYTANITITSGTATAVVPVTLTVSTSGAVTSAIVAPGTLTFWYQTNSGAAVWPQQILLSGAPGATYSVTAGGATWLSADQTAGAIPASGYQPVTVRVAAASAPVGSSTGTLAVTVGAQSATVGVTMNVVSTPVISPLLLGGFGDVATIYQVGTPFPFLPVMQLTSSGSAITFTTSGSSWITVTTDSNTTPANLTITVDPTQLSNGLNSGSITITGPAGGPQVIPVVVGVAGGFTLDQTSVALTAPQGGSSQSQAVHLTSSTSASFTATASTSSGGSGWLTVSPGSGTASSTATTLTITANPAGLAQGTYNGTVAVTVGSTSQNIGVTFTVTSPGTGGTITPSPASLSFQYASGGTLPTMQGLSLGTSGANVAFTAVAATSSGGAWLQVAPTSGTAPVTLQVSVSPASLTPGAYTGIITITPTGGTPVVVNVTLTVTGPPPAPGISLSQNSLQFTYNAGNPAPAAQSVSVSGTGAIQFAATASSSGWLSVSPASGTTPSSLSVAVNPANLGAGNYAGTITVTPSNGAAAQTITVALTVTAPLPTITSVQNAASYAANAVAPGEIVAIFGTAMGPAVGQTLVLDQSGNVATTLANTQVLFNGIPAPVLYASATQVNAVAPYQLAGRSSTIVQVKYGGTGSNTVSMPVSTTVPGLFTQNGSGAGAGAILNSDLSINGSGNPAAKGSTIVIYMTGEGQTNPAGVNGKVSSGPTYPQPVLPVAVLIDGQPATISFYGEAPTLVSGVLQVNATVPASARSGDVPIVVTVGPNPSQLNVTVSVK